LHSKRATILYSKVESYDNQDKEGGKIAKASNILVPPCVLAACVSESKMWKTTPLEAVPFTTPSHYCGLP
jgi:hypothetical protein